jgi:hypothetical protein
MRWPRMRVRVGRLMVTVAIVAVLCGAEMAKPRRAALLTLADNMDREEFQSRGSARRYALMAKLYENPPSTEYESQNKWEEMHPLPHEGCMATYPSMEDLTTHAEDWRRTRIRIFRSLSERLSTEAAELGRTRRELQRAAYLPWESLPPDRPLPTATTHRPPEGLSVGQLRVLFKGRKPRTETGTQRVYGEGRKDGRS